MAQYPAAATNTFRLVTKADTTGSTSLGSATVSADSGVAGTLGSWAQIIASTSAESYVTAIGIAVTSALGTSDFPLFVELGSGGAGSETTRFGRVVPIAGTTATFGVIVPLDVPFRVTASKRIAARVSVNSSGLKSVTVYVYGVPIANTEGN